MAFAAGKTVYFTGLLSVVDFIKQHPDLVSQAIDTNNFSAIPDPEFKDKIDWLFAHFAPDPDQKQLLLSHPEWLKTALQKAVAADVKIAPSDIKLSAPHEAYLHLHAARLGLNDTQTRWFVDQQKQAAAAKAIDDLATQGVTTPDKTQIQAQIQARINWDNRHTVSLQRAVTKADAHISRQLQQILRPVIAQNPTIPRAQVAQAAYELAQLSYQALKPQIPTIGSDKNLAAVLKAEIFTPERLNQVATLQAFGFTPDQFSAAIDTTSRTLFRRYLKAARTNLRLLQMYGEETEHLVTTTTPSPEIHPRGAPGFHDLRTAYGYPGETLINAADPDAAENTIINLPKALIKAVTYPIRAWVIGNIETSFVSLSLTRSQATVQAFALRRVYPLLPDQLKQTQDFNQIQTWIKSQVQALREGHLTLDFDSREKLLEANNNLVLLEFGQKYRALLEKIPGMKFLLQKLNFFGDRINPLFVGYSKAFLSLAFRSDPLTAANIIFDYGLVRPTAQILFRSVVIPLTRHLPFGWDLKPTAFGQEVYWKPAKWVKDKVKAGLFKLAETTGLKRAGEWIAQNIFKTTFAKLAAAFTGLATGFLIAWGALKKSIKATAGLLFLFLVTHGLPTALAALIGGGITAWLLAGLATTGAVLLGITSLPVLAVIAVVTFAIALPLAALFWGFMYLKSIGALSALGSWFTGSLIPGISQFFASLGHISIPFSATWFGIGTASIIGYQTYQNIQRQTAMIAPTLGGLTGYPGTLPGGIIIPGPGGPYPTCWPSQGRITQGPGCDLNLPGGGGTHCTGLDTNSVDIAGFTGQPIYATHDGTATAHTDLDSCYGNYVTITSPLGFTSYYAHLQQASFTGTIDITAGTIIGYEDASTAPGCFDSPNSGFGPHLHYELRGLDLAPPYIPHLAAAGLSTTDCFASQAGGSSVPSQPSPLQPPPLTPPTPFPTSCQTFGGTCVSSGQCPVSGCGIARPVGDWADCQTPAACCDTTGIVSSQCATTNFPSLPSLTSCRSRGGVCTASTSLGCPGGNSCRLVLPSSSSWTDCQVNDICCNNLAIQCRGP